MNKKTTPDIGTRIRQLAAEISAIAEFAEGSIKKTASTYATKDGTRKRSKPQYKFQTRGSAESGAANTSRTTSSHA